MLSDNHLKRNGFVPSYFTFRSIGFVVILHDVEITGIIFLLVGM